MKRERYEVLIFDTSAGVAEAAASQWLREVEKLGPDSRPYCVALAGGRITVQFFDAITQKVRRRKTPISTAVHFFWGDERCVPPTDEQSNYRLAKEHLLDPLAVPERQIHRIRGEIAPAAAAEQATAELTAIAPFTEANQPVFDLIFLGLGENGHTASLFPEESQALRANSAVYRAVVGSKPPPQRVTLGYPAIAAARQVWVLVSGSGKEEAFRESLTPGGRTPLGQVLEARSRTRIFSDVKPPAAE